MLFMSFNNLVILTTCLVYFINELDIVNSACADLDGKFVSITETDPSRTLLFNVSKPASAQVSFSMKAIQDVTTDTISKIQDKYFMLTDHSTYFMMQLNNTLDLELIYKDFQVELSSITLHVKCGNPTYDVIIVITPVNEFPPVFNGAPYSISVKESLSVGSSVFDLKDNVHDQDIPKPLTFYYNIWKYLIEDYDGKDKFRIPTTTRGEVALKETLDYDTMERKNLFLNVSVADDNTPGMKVIYTYINITVTDADDQAPYFDFPGCGHPCVAPPYEAVVKPNFKGTVPITPDRIKAKDDDTLGTKMFFSIQGNDYGMFVIDRNTGVIIQNRSVLETGSRDSEFRLIIQVVKDSTDLSAIAILTVKIEGRQPNGTDTSISEDASEEKGTSLLIPVIILGVLLIILIVATVVVFILMRRKQRRLLVSPEHDKSEPQTEEEEIQDTDRSQEYNNVADANEKQMFGKTTRAIGTDMYPIPSGRAKQLPPLPLRDSATETTEMRKKKRSRKRNKKKEPEIFDGTREYNMGADPEFFDSSDKSKIKRSQRSKKADSTLPINVPNDQPTEYENLNTIHM